MNYSSQGRLRGRGWSSLEHAPASSKSCQLIMPFSITLSICPQHQISKQQPFILVIKLKNGCSNEAKMWLQSQIVNTLFNQDSSSLNYPIHCSIRTACSVQASAWFSWQLTGDGCLEIFSHATIESIELDTTLKCEPICQDVLSRAKNPEIIADIFCFNFPLLKPSSS